MPTGTYAGARFGGTRYGGSPSSSPAPPASRHGGYGTWRYGGARYAGSGVPDAPIYEATVEALAKASATFSPFRGLIPPQPVPGPTGLHDYEVIICDKWGIAKGQLSSAVPTQVTWSLDDINTAAIDVWMFDQTFIDTVPPSSIPGGGVEIQVWRDQAIIFWGWIVSVSFDKDQAHLSCSDLLWPLSQLNFGPVVSEYLVNAQFEFGLEGWTGVGTTPTIEYASAGGIVALGSQAVRLTTPPTDATEYTDGVTDGSTATLTSASASFSAADVGRFVAELDTQGAIADGTTIVSVESPTSCTMSATSTAAATGITFTIGAVNSYLYQDVGVSVSDAGAVVAVLSGWYYVDPNYVPFAPAQGVLPNGQVITDPGIYCHLSVGGVVQTFQFQPINLSSPIGQWTRIETGITIPSGFTGVLEVRLYGPVGSVVWDACQLTAPESVGSSLLGSDVIDIYRAILGYAQDPTRGKASLAFWPPETGGVIGGDTGVVLQRHYQLADNAGVLDSLNEFPSIAVCDHEVVYDATGHFRGLQVFSPAKGAVKYNVPIDLGGGDITDLQGSVDGSQVGTSQRVMGQGSSGSSEDIGFVMFPSYLGGRVSPLAQIEQGSDLVTASDINFTTADIGQGAYCLTPGALPIGTVIIAIISSSVCQLSNVAALNANPCIFGVGGVVLDRVQSAIPDQPIATLQQTANSYLYREMAAQTVPTHRQRADGPNGLMGRVGTGDVIPVVASYGWLQVPPQLMRIASLTLYPPTEEMEMTLNTINAGQV